MDLLLLGIAIGYMVGIFLGDTKKKKRNRIIKELRQEKLEMYANEVLLNERTQKLRKQMDSVFHHHEILREVKPKTPTEREEDLKKFHRGSAIRFGIAVNNGN